MVNGGWELDKRTRINAVMQVLIFFAGESSMNLGFRTSNPLGTLIVLAKKMTPNTVSVVVSIFISEDEVS